MFTMTQQRPLWARALIVFGAAFAATFTILVLGAAIAHADTVTTQPASGAVWTVSPTMLAIIGGFLTPLATGVLMKLNASDGAKAICSTILMALVAVGTELVTKGPGDFAVSDLVIIFFTTLGAHVGSWLVWWKSASPTDNSPTADALPNVGFGGSVTPAPAG